MGFLIATQGTSVLLQNNFVEMQLIRPFSLLIIKWKRQISFEERVFGYWAATEYLKEYQVENLLVNNEKIFLLSGSDKNWLSEILSKLFKETLLTCDSICYL